MTSAEQQHTADRSPTESLIRDLYAIVAFYLTHPEHPRPTGITLSAHVPPAEVEAAAARFAGGHVYGDVAQCHHDLPDTSVPVNFIISSHSTERPL